MSTEDKMLSKIRALLAHAEDQAATTAEAETFLAKATELMAKYGIDRALLAATAPHTDQVGDKVVVVPGPYAMGRMNLLYQVATALGVRSVLRHKRKAAPGTVELHLFGMESDLQRVEVLYTSLLIQELTAQQRDVRDSREAQNHLRRWKRDHIEGFAAMIYLRLVEAERRAAAAADGQARAQTGKSMELVLLDRKALVDRRLGSVYPQTVKTSSSRRVGSGYWSGQTAGQRADLGGTRVGGGGRTALSR